MKAITAFLLTARMSHSTRPSASVPAGPREMSAVLRFAQKHNGFCKVVFAMVALATLAMPSVVQAQVFQTLPSLSFAMPVGGASPLPQVVTPTSTGASFNYTAAASTATGGNWLSIGTNLGYGEPTASQTSIVVTPVAAMAAGTYTGSIVFSSTSSSTVKLTVPVTLTVVAATAGFPANLPGELSYSMVPSGKAPPSQAFVIDNGGTGSFSWTLSESYANGSGWLAVSSTSGVSGATVTATVNPSALPGSGLVAGSYAAELAVKSSGGTITVPVVAIVASPVFRQMNPLNFVQLYGGANPLPQMMTVASNGATFNFGAAAVNSTGGSWLSISPSNYGYGQPTPQPVTVSVTPAVNLAVGTYTSEVEVVSTDNTQTIAVPVTLTIVPNTAAFFDDLPGALDYSMTTGGDTPPAQSFQVRNAGAGTLAWTLSVSTSDGGNWLTASAASGTAPESVTVTVNPANLPGAGQTPGSYTGQLILLTASGHVTVPITFVVGAQEFREVSPITFTKTYAGSNPLPQVFTAASTGAAFNIYASVENSTGGNWLTISPSNYGYGQPTPQSITVSANPDPSLPAGTYSAAVFVESTDGTISMTVPVSLVIEPASAAFFDDLPGQLSFSMATDGNAPPPQPIQIRNAGTGTLNWTGAVSTSDGGNWLSLSAASGTAPSNITAKIVPANLPGGGLVAGTFTGQVVLQSSNDLVTIPVTVVVGTTAFRQIDGLNFNMTFGGANPLPQVINAVSTGTNFNIYATAVNSTGGNWLSISPSNYGYGLATPRAITVNVNAAAQLAAGTYSAEVLIQSTDNTLNITVPVTLTVSAPTAAFFDQLPGQLTFSMLTGGKTPPALPLQIRNAGAGTLSWTGSVTTSDGGNWLSLNAASGTAPSVISASVNPANLPGAGLVAGLYTGQVVLQSATDRVTVPVSVAVGPNGFEQVGGLNFNMTYGGANPLPQVIPAVNAGATFNITAVAFNASGGNWLQISPSNYGYGQPLPQLITATVNPASPLAVGTYTGEVIVSSTDGSLTLTVPVTLTVSAPTAAYFDQLPSQLTFSMITGAKAFASLPFQIRNAGTGTLAWTATTSTSDGGGWLSLSATSGTAPTTVTASVNPANLPGAGLVAGIFTGQIVLQSATDRETISVSVSLGPNGFEQINPINFTMTYGSSNPLPQVIPVLSAGAAFNIIATPFTSTGGNWLSISPSSYGYGQPTPQLITASVNPASPLAVGTYTGVIDIVAEGGGIWMTVPVTLTVEPATATFFDALPGELTFSMNAGAAAPQSQLVSVRNGGAGALAFTASTTTSDGGGWLTLSATSGTAPYLLNVGVNSAKLPGAGLVAGLYTGEVLLQTNGDTVTIPVTVSVGPVIFIQNNPLSFTKTVNGANPLPQVITLNASGTGTYAQAHVVNATGGNWLSIDFSGNYLPHAITVTANPAVTLAAGTYTAEVVATSTNSAAQPTVIPVTLTVEPATATFFDTLPGELTFSMNAGTVAPQSQVVSVRNAGAGALTFTASTTTSDGGGWLTLSATSGTAPYLLNVGVNSAKLPGTGLIAGVYIGEILLQTNGDAVTIPVTVNVGSVVFTQNNPISFSKTVNGANPLPQVITLNATGSGTYAQAHVFSSTGGNWLSIDFSGNYLPQTVTVTANPAVTLPAGTYTAEIVATATNTAALTTVIPVTLTVEPTTATFFDTIQGGLTFSGPATGAAIASQPMPIRNAGPGTLDWVATALTSDRGNWLAISPGSGTAPITPTVSINPANLPGKGLVAGIYTGQIMLQSASDLITVPVSVTLGDPVFNAIAPLNFSMTYEGTNPAAQSVTISSNDVNNSIYLKTAADNSTGGNWLSINSGGNYTPLTLTVTANPATPLAPGVYTSEIVGESTTTGEPLVIPVSLTVNRSVATATPSFSPGGGTYSTDQVVTITDATLDAAIYYTTDGTTPTTSSARYSVPLQVTGTQTIEALAIAPGYLPSAIFTAKYTITAPVAAEPAATQTVTIAEATAGVTVYYTTNGTTPTNSSAIYTGPIIVTSTTTLKFIAIGSNFTASPVRTVIITVQ